MKQYKVFAIVDFACVTKSDVYPFELKQCFIGSTQKDVLAQIKERKHELQQKCDHTIKYGQLLNKDTFKMRKLEYKKIKESDLYVESRK